MPFLVITSLERIRIIYIGNLRANLREKVKMWSISPEVGDRQRGSQGLDPGLARREPMLTGALGFLFRHFKVHFHSLPLILSFIPAISRGISGSNTIFYQNSHHCKKHHCFALRKIHCPFNYDTSHFIQGG